MPASSVASDATLDKSPLHPVAAASQSLWKAAETTAEFLDVPRASYSVLAGVVFGFGMVRALLESALLGEPLHTAEGLAHLPLFFVAAFFAGGLVISALAKTGFRSTLNAMMVLWPLTVLIPVIEHYGLGSSDRYSYVSMHAALSGDFALHGPGGAAPILIAELLLFCVAGAGFVYLRSGSVRRGLLAPIALGGLALISGMPGLLVPWLDPANSVQVFKNGTVIDTAFVAYYTVIAVGLLAVGAWRDTGARFADIRFAVRPWPTLVYGFVLLLAYVYGLKQAGTAMGISAAVDAVLLSVAWAMTWQMVVMFNDAYDVDIDKVAHPRRPLVRGLLSQESYLDLAALLGAWALLAISLVSARAAFLVVGGAGVLSVVYSVPPFVLKRRLLGSSVVMALAAGIVALGGSLAGGAHLDVRSVGIGAVLILIFGLGVATKDARDQDGDAQAGSRTLFTVFGREGALRITSLLVLVSAILPVLIVFDRLSLIVCLPLAAATAVTFFRTGDMRYVFPLYFAEMVFIGVRLVG